MYRKLVGVWALDKLVHTNRYCEITYNIFCSIQSVIMCTWAKVYEIAKTENSLKARNYLYFICKYFSENYFQNRIVSKQKTFTQCVKCRLFLMRGKKNCLE